MSAPDWWRTFFTGLPVEMWLRVPTEEQTRAEVDFIEKVLRLPPGAKVLDVPCGGGRHSLELAARGHRVTGVDLSDDFLRAARAGAAERSPRVAWEQREMTDLPWREEFDGAFCFGNSFGYLDDAGNARFLAAVARALRPGGRFVLDTGLTAEGLFPTFQERRWLQVGDILFLSQGQYDPVSGRLKTEYTFVRGGEFDTRPASMRVHTYRELSGLLEAAGFSGCEGYGSLEQGPFRLGSPRLLLVAVKSPSAT
jgi:SAM-dependent methyltransferase